MDINPLTTENDWMTTLRDKLVAILCGTDAEKEAAYPYIGCCYQFYAPASIYKYFNDSYQSWENIKNNKLWYSAPTRFNDVFDCDITCDEKKLYESILKMCPDARNARIGSPMWKQLKAATKDAHLGMQTTFQKLRSTTGICCFSEHDNSLLMWAHYANDHRGLCVEYDLLETNKQLHFTPIPVIYSNQRVSFDSLDATSIEQYATKLLIDSLTTKSPEWSYEKEWRIIRDDAACGSTWDSTNDGALLDMIRPTSITLGCMAQSNFEQEVIAFCKENKISLFKMKKSPAKYQLEKTPLLQFDA